jgi:hypothetical protein
MVHIVIIEFATGKLSVFKKYLSVGEVLEVITVRFLGGCHAING